MANNSHRRVLSLMISIFMVMSFSYDCLVMAAAVMAKEAVRVGVVLDRKSTVGVMAESWISMAMSDFYSLHSHFQTRLALFTKDSEGDVVAAAYAVLNAIEKEEVHAIIGPQRSSQAKFVIEIGKKAHVPIISFSATSPSLSPSQNQYFVRIAHDDSSQVKAITSLVRAYGWEEIIIIYEDTDYGNDLIPSLLDGFQGIGIRVAGRIGIPMSYKQSDIGKELGNLKKKHKFIFLVHMAAALGSKLFLAAKNEGMMSEGYAWLVTQGLSTLLDPVDEIVMDSMLGALGVRPYVPTSRKLDSFKSKWKTNVNLFGLWAYDTVWALAQAVETAGTTQSSFIKRNSSQCSIEAMGTSEMGPRILKSLLTTSFQGLSGDFHLTKRDLEPKVFEIFNVVERRERILGYYVQDGGFSAGLNDDRKTAGLAAKDILKQPIWPGDTHEIPKKWRIGVPVRAAFNEFIKVEWHPVSGKPIVSGFSKDVFEEVVKALPFPFPYEFIPFANEHGESKGTYDELLNQIPLQIYDVVVGDTTIVANRSTFVDFTLPYSESGVSMVVLMTHDKRDMWIFLKPLSPDLWIVTALGFMFTGFVVWVLEHRINTDFRGPPDQQVSTVFWFSFSTLVFAHRENLLSGWTRFVVLIWVFVILIISQSYTANLASMLTVKQLKPTFADIEEIQKNGHVVGYQRNSFVADLLVKQLKFNETNLRNFSTPEEYYEALTNGVVAAIFDEIPYIKLFLAKYCSQFEMIGPTYKTDGFGFAFPLGSPIVSNISRAILSVTEDWDTMKKIENKNFGVKTSCEDAAAFTSSSSLTVSSFGGLFIITGVASFLSLFIHITKFIWFHWPPNSNTTVEEGSIWFQVLELAKHFDKKDFSSNHHSVESPPSSNVDDEQDHSGAFNRGGENVIGDVDHGNPISTNDTVIVHAPNS